MLLRCWWSNVTNFIRCTAAVVVAQQQQQQQNSEPALSAKVMLASASKGGEEGWHHRWLGAGGDLENECVMCAFFALGYFFLLSF